MMLVQFAPSSVDRLTGGTAGGRGSHDIPDANLGRTLIVGRHATTHVTFRDDSDQLEMFGVLDNGRAAAT